MLGAATLLETYQQADAMLAAGKLQQAADMCKQMLETNPNFAYGYHLMSSLFRTTGNLEKALSFSEIAIRLDPSVPPFHVQQGQILFTMARFDDAGMAFERAHRLCPTEALYLILTADVSAQQGRYEEALALFTRARALSDIPEIDEHEGLCLIVMGDLTLAEQRFERLIARKPEHPAGYIHKGKVLLLTGRDREAEVAFAKALACHAASQEALHGMAVVNERQGQMDAAITYAVQAVNAPGTIFDSLMLLGALLLRRQSWAGATQVYEQALSLMPGSLYALRGLADALLPQRMLRTMDTHIMTHNQTDVADKALAFLKDCMHGANPPMPPAEYIAALFDNYAGRYEYFLQPQTLYTPSMVTDVLRTLPMFSGQGNVSLLDLGCGAGELGRCLQDRVGHRVGVDLSPRMLDRARSKQCYHDLYALDATEFVLGSDRTFDLVAALDLLPYMGDLTAFFQALRNVMAAGSVAVVTAELDASAGAFQLKPSGRYVHTAVYLDALLQDHGYDVVLKDTILLRLDAGQPVQGLMYVIKKKVLH